MPPVDDRLLAEQYCERGAGMTPRPGQPCINIRFSARLSTRTWSSR